MADIEKSLGSLTRIEGYLKIHKSKYFKTLSFLKNLEYIAGEKNSFGLIIYDNKNLNDLWTIKNKLQIASGGIYIERNWKLCNNIVNKFIKSVEHEKKMDKIQKNDIEILCFPVKLNINLKVSFPNPTTFVKYF